MPKSAPSLNTARLICRCATAFFLAIGLWFLAPIATAGTISLGLATNNFVSANIQPDSSEVGTSVNIWMGATYGTVLYLRNGQTWAPYVSGTFPIAISNTVLNAGTNTVTVVNGIDIAGLAGLQIHVGYGATQTAMLNTAGHLAMIYQVPGPVIANTTYMPGTSCPVDSNLQCSQWITNGPSCSYQSCTCYFNTPGVGSDDSGFWTTRNASQNVTGIFDCKLNGGMSSNQIAVGSCSLLYSAQVRAFVDGCNPPTYSLTASAAGGNGTVVAAPPGPSYLAGTVVTLTATPRTGYTFSGWSGACTGTGTCSVTVSSNSSVSATFTPSLVGTCSNGATNYPTCTLPQSDNACKICAFDVYCTVFGYGGCWRCNNSTYSNGVCVGNNTSGSISSPGHCVTDSSVYTICN